MIGFNYNGKYLPELAEPEAHSSDEVVMLIDDIEPRQRSRMASELLRQEGMSKAMELLQQYFSNCYLPLITGKERDLKYMKKLSKIRERYFSEI